jgi:rubrerythrin
MSRDEGDPLKPKNPGGYLAQAIEEDYASPKGFKSVADVERERLAKEAATAQRKAERAAKAKLEAEKRAAAEQDFERKTRLVTEYLEGLTREDRKKLEDEALSSSLFGPNSSELIRTSLIHNHVMGLLKAAGRVEK